MKGFIESTLIYTAVILVLTAVGAGIGFGLSVGWYAGARIITTNDNIAIMTRIMEDR